MLRVTRRLVCAALLTALAIGTTRDARADMIAARGVYMPVGANVGFGTNQGPTPNGLLLGGEASLVYFDQLRWIGGYADVIRDFGADQTRVSFGPEVGIGIFGFDAGFLAGDKGMGYVARGTLSLLFFHLYSRFGHSVEREETFVELGLLAKFPILLAELPIERRRGPAPSPTPELPPPEEPPPTVPSSPSSPSSPSPEDGPPPNGPLSPDEPAPPDPWKK